MFVRLGKMTSPKKWPLPVVDSWSVGAGVNVLAIDCVLHQSKVEVSGQCEMGYAADQTSYMLSVCVQGNFLHATLMGENMLLLLSSFTSLS